MTIRALSLLVPALQNKFARMFDRAKRVWNAAALLTALASLPLPARAADVQVNAARKFQTMTGWEATASGLEVTSDGRYDPWWEQNNGVVLDYLVGSLGVNRLRLELHSGSENPVDYWSRFVGGQIDYAELQSHFYEKINDDASPGSSAAGRFQFAELDFGVETEVLPVKQRLEARGEKLLLNLCYVDFASGRQGSLSHATNEAEYSELVVGAFDHLRRKYQLTPDALELVLEPDNTRDWRGAQIGKALVAVKQRLHAAGHDPELIVPSTASAALAAPYLSEVSAVAGASGVATTLAYHRYPAGDLGAIFMAAQRYGMRTAMLEHFTADVDELLEDLTVANVSAWQKYAIAQPSSAQDYAYLTVDRRPVAAPVVSLNARAAPLLPIFRAARSGAQRIEATSDDPALKTLAFINTDQRYAVIVKATSSTAIRVLGLPAGTYDLLTVKTDATSADSGIPKVLGAASVLSLQIPAGVTTIFEHARGAEQTSVRAPALGPIALAALCGVLLVIGRGRRREPRT